MGGTLKRPFDTSVLEKRGDLSLNDVCEPGIRNIRLQINSYTIGTDLRLNDVCEPQLIYGCG